MTAGQVYSIGMEDQVRQDALEKIMAMTVQIPSYYFGNYLVEVEDTFDAKCRHSPVAVCDESYHFYRSPDTLLVDRDWRKRICEWMYKVRLHHTNLFESMFEVFSYPCCFFFSCLLHHYRLLTSTHLKEML